ncbi:uncharacterized protein LOC131605527 [Vicia villosa]|uniref:uncharacterized protein LOC131605527 n=1 Tax=Vicia villosa TaxID=3911 RepID=UPI00273C6B0E|nr:uncharacterized protein LOC131605527 [Vicia villosa]
MDKVGSVVTMVPIMNRTNYECWQTRMEAYLKTLVHEVWRNVVKTWDPPRIVSTYGTVTEVLKAEEDWDDKEISSAQANFKALYVIFRRFEEDAFMMISRSKQAKCSWEIIREIYEKYSQTRMINVQLLNAKFENLRLKEDESLQNFHMNIQHVVSEFEDLREKMSEDKVVKKIPRPLPERFDKKLVYIINSYQLSTMIVDNLITLLRTVERLFLYSLYILDMLRLCDMWP